MKLDCTAQEIVDAFEAQGMKVDREFPSPPMCEDCGTNPVSAPDSDYCPVCEELRGHQLLPPAE